MTKKIVLTAENAKGIAFFKRIQEKKRQINERLISEMKAKRDKRAK